MTAVGSAGAVRELVARRLAERRDAYESWFAERSPQLALLCHAMAERFARGGRLLAVGVSPTARSDVRHVAVEFVHPVIVGKRALPALGLAGDSAPLEIEVRLAVAPDDVVMAFGDGVSAAVAAARAGGALTIGFDPVGAEWELSAPGGDPFVAQELVETAYHVLWELVHVFFEHRGLLEGRSDRRAHDAGAASFLYPFLSESEHDLDAVLADVAGSAALKAREVCELREATLAPDGAGIAALAAAAGELQAGAGRGRAAAGGRERWLGDRRDRRRRRLRVGWQRVAVAAGAGPDRRLRDPDRDRQRYRRRGDLRPPDHRLRAGR